MIRRRVCSQEPNNSLGASCDKSIEPYICELCELQDSLENALILIGQVIGNLEPSVDDGINGVVFAQLGIQVVRQDEREISVPLYMFSYYNEDGWIISIQVPGREIRRINTDADTILATLLRYKPEIISYKINKTQPVHVIWYPCPNG